MQYTSVHMQYTSVHMQYTSVHMQYTSVRMPKDLVEDRNIHKQSFDSGPASFEYQEATYLSRESV
jgi:hypothetical protein